MIKWQNANGLIQRAFGDAVAAGEAGSFDNVIFPSVAKIYWNNNTLTTRNEWWLRLLLLALKAVAVIACEY